VNRSEADSTNNPAHASAGNQCELRLCGCQSRVCPVPVPAARLACGRAWADPGRGPGLLPPCLGL
jgi:hypothetical protein